MAVLFVRKKGEFGHLVAGRPETIEADLSEFSILQLRERQ